MPKAKSHMNFGAVVALGAFIGMFYIHSQSGSQSIFKAFFSGFPRSNGDEFIFPAAIAAVISILVGGIAARLPDWLDRIIGRHRGPFHTLSWGLAVLGVLIALGVVSLGAADIVGFYLRVAVLSAIIGYVSHPLLDSLDSFLPFR